MNDQRITDLMQARGSKAKVAYTQIARAQAATKNVAFLSLITTHNFKDCCLFIRPDDVSIPVRVELVETLRQAQGERFIVHKAESITCRAVAQLDEGGDAL